MSIRRRVNTSLPPLSPALKRDLLSRNVLARDKEALQQKVLANDSDCTRQPPHHGSENESVRVSQRGQGKVEQHSPINSAAVEQ